MKQLILITAMLVAFATKMVAQEGRAVEIKNLKTETTQVTNETHQFDIVAHEVVDVYLKLKLKEEDHLCVLITDEKNNVVLKKEITQAGDNKVSFAMDEKDKYKVSLIGQKPSNLIVSFVEN